MSLESLVPPLPLCQQLQPGDFPESALVWHLNNAGGYSVFLRMGVQGIKGTEKISAPTLAEILDALEETECVSIGQVNFWRSGQTEVAVVVNGNDIAEVDTSPATAALRLWMKVNGREVKG